MNDLRQTLKKGTLLIIETGEYSDRNWGGPVRLLATATKQELADLYIAEWKPEDQWERKPSPDGFLPWLVKTGRAEDVDNIHTWHIGSYGEFQP